MHRRLQWISDNKEWVFSGVGVVLVSAIATLLVPLLNNVQPRDENFHIAFSVLDSETNLVIESVSAQIETTSETFYPLEDATNPLRFRIPTTKEGERGRLAVVADGYKVERVEVSLVPKDLPMQVLLYEVAIAFEEPTTNVTPTVLTRSATEIPTVPISPTNPILTPTSISVVQPTPTLLPPILPPAELAESECIITITNRLVSLKSEPDKFSRDLIRVPTQQYVPKEHRFIETPFGEESWFMIQVDTRVGWIENDTWTIGDKTPACP